MDDAKQQMISSMQGAARLHLAYIGVANGLFDALGRLAAATPAQLADAAEVDAAYVTRWCDAAFGFELLDADEDTFALTELGARFRSDADATLLPFAVNVVLGAHMAERAAGLMRSGERPGESVLAEQETVLPLFGPMLEHTFAPMFESTILPAVPLYREVDDRGGLVVDLGCGNGWYVRALAKRCPHVRGVGLDGFAENVAQATRLANRDGVADRVRFQDGDIHHFTLDEPADLIAMNRALHHVWEQSDRVMHTLAEHLAPGGAAVIWEPRWPDDRATLRHPRARGMGLQNLMEHVQGNHFLRPSEIEDAMRAAGLEPEVHLFAEGHEQVVVGRKPA